MTIQSHPAAACFPLMEGEAYAKLRDDIRDNGQRIPIVLCEFDGEPMILDGRNRYRVAVELGIRPKTTTLEIDDEDCVNYVVSVNLARRHLNESQRAMVAAKLATLPGGRPGKLAKSSGLSNANAAKTLNVGESTVRQAKAVVEKAEPDVVKAVESGDLSLNAASEIAKLTKAQQIEALNEARNQPRKREPSEQRDIWMTREIRLVESDVLALKSLLEYCADSGDPRVSAGMRVVARMVPTLSRLD